MATMPLMAPSCPLQTHTPSLSSTKVTALPWDQAGSRALQEAQNAFHCFLNQNALGFVSITTVGGDTTRIKHLVSQNEQK